MSSRIQREGLHPIIHCSAVCTPEDKAFIQDLNIIHVDKEDPTALMPALFALADACYAERSEELFLPAATTKSF